MASGNRGRLAGVLAAVAFMVGVPAARAEDRVLWYSIGDGLTNTTNLQAAIDFAVANRFNGICVLARYRANAYYIPNRNFATYPNPEPAVSGAAGDTLQYVIDHGREAGLKVYASFGCFAVTDGSNTYPPFLPASALQWRYRGSRSPTPPTTRPTAPMPASPAP